MGCGMSRMDDPRPEARTVRQAQARRKTLMNGANASDGEGGGTGVDRKPQYESDNLALKPLEQANRGVRGAYAAVSHPGGEPGRPVKTNQDSVLISELPDLNAVLLAVFDGHGINGHKASRYVKEQFSKHWSQLMHAEKDSAAVKSGDCGAVLRNAAKRTNFELLRQKFDLSTSGSTGVIVCIVGDVLTCANVGDSRAVVGVRQRGEKGPGQCVHLSNDHKPDLPEESHRIQMAGGRIHPIEVGGEFVGPPRVWIADEEAPGLCMSRSFGDQLGASVGVICDPEIKSYTLPTGDEEVVLVVGSDGIFEFFENDAVVAKTWESLAGHTTAQTAWDLIAMARAKWKIEEGEVVDDCTAVVCTLGREPAAGGADVTVEDA